MQRLVQDSGSAMAQVIFEHLETFSQQLDPILVKHSLLKGSWVAEDNDKDADKARKSGSGEVVGEDVEDVTQTEEAQDHDEGKRKEIWQPHDDVEARQVVSMVKEMLIKVGILDPSTAPKPSEWMAEPVSVAACLF